jgi:signal transduction protein with GAF and PtsI domain
VDRREKLIEAGLVLSSEHSLDVVLQRIVDLAAEVTGARYGALGVLSPEGDRLVEFVTTGITSEQRGAIGDLPVGHGLLGLLITDAKPLRISRISAHPRSVGFPPNHPAMTSLLGAPILARGRVFGNIYLTDKRDADAFTREDEDVLVTLATQAGVAIEGARLQQESLARARIVEAFREIATALVEGGGSAEALSVVGRLARELMRADTVTIAVPDETACAWRSRTDSMRWSSSEGSTRRRAPFPATCCERVLRWSWRTAASPGPIRHRTSMISGRWSSCR